MKTVKTPSFVLAVYAKGVETADKLALILPGRLDTKDYAHCVSHVNYMASKGYYALSFDPPGTWKSPGDISLYTTTKILKAIDELIEQLGSRPTVLIGHSRGGTNAMLAGTKNPWVTHIVAIMSSAGPSTIDLPKTGDAVKLSYRDLPPGISITKEQKEFALPISYFQDQAKYDVRHALKTSKKPKLFFYGSQDALVSAESVKALFDQSAEPKMIHELKTGHNYRLHADAVKEVNTTIGEFLGKYSE